MKKCILLFLLFNGFASIALADYQKPRQKPDQWQTADAKAAGWQVTLLEDMTARISAGEFKKITSVLVAQGGKLLYEQYFNGSDINSPNNMRSATKSLNALAVGLALEKGYLTSVNQKIVEFFPEQQPLNNADARKDAITIEDIMTMSSMLECDDWNNHSRGHEERMYIYHDWVKFVLDLPVKGFAPWQDKPAQSRYGRSFSYCTGGAFLLSAIVEKASQMSMDKLLDKFIHQPMGITQVHWPKSARGITSGAGGTEYRSRDFLKIGQLMANHGKWQQQQLLSSQWVEQATKAHVAVGNGDEYGYQWWRVKFDVDGQPLWSIAASGNGGNYLFVIPQLNLVSIITSQAYNQRYAHKQSRRLFQDFVLASLPKAVIVAGNKPD